MTLNVPASLGVPGADLASAELVSRDTAAVLSATGGPYPANEALQAKLVYLDNGELLVHEAARLDQAVLAYENDLRNKGATIRPVKVRLDEIRAHYQRHREKHGSGNVADAELSQRQSQVMAMIRAAYDLGASDIHIVVKEGVGVVRFRVDGMLLTGSELPRDTAFSLCSTIYQSMCDLADPTFRPTFPQDARLKQSFFGAIRLYGVRIATRPTDRGLLMVMRLLYARERRTLRSIGYMPLQYEQILRLTQRKNGVNIFSGPTGSGKSTSLALLYGELVSNYKELINALTIEDPPEGAIHGAVQTPVQNGDWAGAIRNAMRLDPDVMMVGEIRDLPSAQAAFQGALTGHGIWTTVHANDATTILQRLGDLGLDPGLYTDHTIVTGLINQNLVPLLCDKCNVPWPSVQDTKPRALVDRVSRLAGDSDFIRARGPGCAHCNSTGIRGRHVVAEVITPNLQFMQVFRSEGKAAARAFWLDKMDGQTKTDHLIHLIRQGLVDPHVGEQHVGLLDDEASGLRTFQ